MTHQSAPRSLKHEYELYVEDEIEKYKESISRSALLRIGDEAVAAMNASLQVALNELLICEEVDKIIRKRARIPTYATWRKHLLREMKERQSPEYWGVKPDSALAREIHPAPELRVLVAGTDVAGPALYLAAHGCSVTAVDSEPRVVDHVVQAAEAAHLPGRIEPHANALKDWTPDGPLSAVVCSMSAFEGLTSTERGKVLAMLKSATRDGGVHLLQSIAAGAEVSLTELNETYEGWEISIVEEPDQASFLARKSTAA